MVAGMVWLLVIITAINYCVGYFVMGESPLLPEHRRMFWFMEIFMTAVWFAILLLVMDVRDS